MASSESEKNLPALSTNDSDKGLSSSSSDKDTSTPVNEAVTADVEKKMLEQAPVPAQMANNPVEPPSKPGKSGSSGKAKKSQKPDPYENLPEDEAAILKRQLDIPPAKVNYFTLYRYATKVDLLIIFVSCICAMAAGAAMPLMTVVFGSITGDIGSLGRGNFSHAHFRNQVDHNILYFIYLAIGEFCTVYISMNGFMYTGQHISNKIREQYLASILRQNIGYFDRLGAGEITTRITSDTNNVQDAISEKVGLTLSALATFVTAYIIAFIKYWKLALILSSSVVAILITMTLMSKFIVKYNKQALFAYAKGGTIVEEVLSSIRNATAFGTQDKLAKEYDVHLAIAQISGVRQKALLGSMIGILMFYSYLSYSLCFWQGSRYLRQGVIGVQDIITILLSIMMGAFQLGNVAPNAQAATTGVAAAAKIYATIDRKSPLDPQSEEGEIYDHIDGNVELRNIKHIYPSRPEVVVMNDVNLSVPAGKTTALVGASGSGKSTIVGLVERFYDPVGGEVLLDGHNVQNLNLRWLRQQVSLVSQEPTLFATTIFTNIRHGLIGTEYEYLDDEKVTELIENAAKLANAHGFITQLPEGYQTNVGDRGFLMSGGQKQRIAIARAMVSNPKILFLDEATSALDTKSEGVVQAALDKAAQGRTTIVIAHRLSTIKHADNIVVMSQGRIVEQGKHDALLESQGAYYNLVEAQRIAQLKEDASREEGEEGEEVAVFDEKDGNILGKEKGEDEEKAGMGDYIEDPADLELGRMKTGKSASSKVIDNKVDAPSKHYSLWTLIKVVAGYNRQEWMQMTLALFFAIISGASNPTASVFFAKSLTILSVGPLDQISFWSWMYFMLAFVTLIARVGMGVLFAYCSEQLVHRARDEAFRTMLRQDIAFFDQDKNSAGALTSFLSTQTTQLAGMSGITLGTILQTVATLVIGYVIALAIGWKLALVCIATVPIVLGCGFFRFWMLARFQANSRAAYEKSAAYACEATSAIRTVASLTREQDVFDNYDAQLVVQFQRALGNNLRSTALYAASQSLMFLCIALAFWYGSTLLNSGEYSEFQFFLCFSAVIFGSQSAGIIFSFAPDMGKAKSAATEMKKLVDRKPEIDTWSKEGEVMSECQGDIEFRDVHFRYPTRPEQPVLRGLDLTVRPGQYVALVGASGCGKSTTIALMERFYDPLVGGVYVDGCDISKLEINNYRRHLALVSQEPTLYQGTIRENILLGADTDPADVPQEAIDQACRDANIYDFILSLPEGFQTVVGSKGSMLSGGQKQRIAIARALLRNPKILLLDEATSALDSESEKVVQAALDKAAKGRTTIAVAHRLSTIQKADMIYVFDQGKIVESGTHNELTAKKGRYFELVNLQSLGKNS